MANQVSFVIVMKDAFVKVSKRIVTATVTMRKKFSTLGKGLGMLTRKFGGLVTAALGFFSLKKFFSVGMKFQDSIADLAAITGAAGKNLQFLQTESLRLAKVSIVSASETANAFKLVASAKAELLEDPKALSNVTEQVLLLSNAAGTSLADSATIVTESLNQFGVSADQANRFVNVLAAGSKFGASEVDQTGAALVRAGVGAKLANVSFEQTNAVLQVLAKRGIKGERAGTALKTVFLRLESMSNKRFKPSIVGLDQAMENLSKRNLSTAKLTKLFGMQGVAVGETMISARKEVAEMAAKITGTGIASQQASIRMATFSKRIESIGIAINEKLIAVFQRLENSRVFSKIAADFTNWLDTIEASDLDKFSDSVGRLAKSLATMAKVIDTLMVPFGFIFDTAPRFITDVIHDLNPNSRMGLGHIGKRRQRRALAEDERDSAIMRAGFLTDDILGRFNLTDLSSNKSKVEGDINIHVTTAPGVSATVKTTARTPGLSIGQNMEPVLQ